MRKQANVFSNSSVITPPTLLETTKKEGRDLFGENNLNVSFQQNCALNKKIPDRVLA